MEQDNSTPEAWLDGFIIGQAVEDPDVVYDQIVLALLYREGDISEHSALFIDGLLRGLYEEVSN